MDTQTLLMMLKGGIPPTIVIAMYAEAKSFCLDFALLPVLSMVWR